MRRPMIVALVLGLAALVAFWLLLQTPGSLQDALSQPIASVVGTQKQLNSTLLEVSETAEPVRAASRRLLQPWGAVHLIRLYDNPESEQAQKR